MEKYIYRLALVNDIDIEMIVPYHFGNKNDALRYVELYISEKVSNHPETYEKVSNTEQGSTCLPYVLKEPGCSRILNFELLYKDNSFKGEKYLAITSIPVIYLE